jgi:hypothetical protein
MAKRILMAKRMENSLHKSSEPGKLRSTAAEYGYRVPSPPGAEVLPRIPSTSFPVLTKTLQRAGPPFSGKTGRTG